MGSRFRCRISPSGVAGCEGTGGGTGSGGDGATGPTGADGAPGAEGPAGPPPILEEIFAFDDQLIGAVEYSLTSNSTTIEELTEAGIYWLWVDVSTLVAGDIYQFFVREKVTVGSAQQSLSIAIGADVEPGPLICGPFALLNGWDFTAIRLSATADRALSWSIRRE